MNHKLLSWAVPLTIAVALTFVAGFALSGSGTFSASAPSSPTLAAAPEAGAPTNTVVAGASPSVTASITAAPEPSASPSLPIVPTAGTTKSMALPTLVPTLAPLSAPTLSPTAAVSASVVVTPSLSTAASTAITPTAVAAKATDFLTLRVDAGGAGYTDTATGLVWQGDRPYGAVVDADGRSWGYWGPRSMQVVATSSGVAHTTASKVYQSQRLGASGYRFDLPNSDYRLTVELAEIYTNVAPGSNVFDVYAQGRPALSGVNVMQSVGRLNAYDRVFTTTVSDGVLQVAFVARSGWAAIAGLVVESVGEVPVTVAATHVPPAPASPSVVAAAPSPTVTPALTESPAASATVSSAAAVTATAAITGTTAAPPTTVVTSTATAATSVNPTATAIASATPTPTPSPVATSAPVAAASPEATLTSTATEAPAPTQTTTEVPPTASPTQTVAALPTAVPPTPTPSAVPTSTPTTVPTVTTVPAPTEHPTPAPAASELGRLTQGDFAVVFNEADRDGAAAVLQAMNDIADRMASDLGVASGPVEVKLFSSRQDYNTALGATAPADQVGNIVDEEHVWLLAPNASRPSEESDILKGVQVEIVRLALQQMANVPQWMRDGLASYEAQLWNDERTQYMQSLVASRRITSLAALGGSSYNYLGGAVTAHTVIDYLVRTYGIERLPSLLSALRTETLDQALYDVCGVTLSDFGQGWLTYVYDTYGAH